MKLYAARFLRTLVSDQSPFFNIGPCVFTTKELAEFYIKKFCDKYILYSEAEISNFKVVDFEMDGDVEDAIYYVINEIYRTGDGHIHLYSKPYTSYEDAENCSMWTNAVTILSTIDHSSDKNDYKTEISNYKPFEHDGRLYRSYTASIQKASVISSNNEVISFLAVD